ncbi:hypothetical protein [Pseudonocardia xinjiangensis]|uniref:hypothetical protein n=1 Tax=Pseudonocardia xinjiangensis TaxID=75289 RepID=UPI00146F7771
MIIDWLEIVTSTASVPSCGKSRPVAHALRPDPGDSAGVICHLNLDAGMDVHHGELTSRTD